MIVDFALKIAIWIWQHVFLFLWPASLPFVSLDGTFIPMLNWIKYQLLPPIHFFNVFFPLDTLFLCFLVYISTYIIVFLWQGSRFGGRLIIGNRVK